MSDRAVFDCMIYLQAAVNEGGPAFACFRLVEAGEVILCVSDEVLAEARDVLTRPALRAKFRQLTSERVDAFLQNVRAKAVTIAEVPKVFSCPRDPDDEPYVNLAIAAGARYLVSRDKDLLDLMKDADFRRRFATLAILDPAAFLLERSGRHQLQHGREKDPADPPE